MGKLLRFLVRLLRAVGWVFGALLALVLSAWIHTRDPLAKRAVVDFANATLADVLYGKIEIEAVTELSLHAVSVSHVALRDEQGNVVIELDRARFELDVIALLAELLLAEDSADLVIEHARVERSMVRAIADAVTREPTLTRALTPRPGKGGPSGGSSSTSRSVRLYFSHLELGVVEAAFTLPGWEQLKPVLGHVKGRVLFSPKGIALDVERFGTTVSGGFGHALRGTGTFALRAPGPLDLNFSGFLDDAEIQSTIHFASGRLESTTRAPRIAPQTVREWFGDWPLVVPLELTLVANGELPELDVSALARAEGSELTIIGPIDLTDGVNATLRAQLSHGDLGALLERAPTTSLFVGADLALEARGDSFTATISGSSEATTIQDQAVPAVDFDLALQPGSVSGSIVLQEPGAEVHAEGQFAQGQLALQARVGKLQLERQRRLRAAAKGAGLSGLSALDVGVELADGQFQARLNLELARFAVGPVRARTARVSAQASGDPSKPFDAKLQFQASGRELLLGPLRFDSGSVRATGNLKGINADLTLTDRDGRRVHANGHVTRDGVVENASFEVTRNDVVLRGKARRIDPEGPSIDVPEFSIQGQSGQLTGHVLAKPGLLEGQLEAVDLRLERVARSVGWDEVPVRGKASLSIDVSIGSELQRGRFDGKLENVSYAEWGDSDFTYWGELKGQAFEGAIDSKDSLGFSTQTKWNGALGGSALDLESWRSFSGRTELSVLSVPLDLLPKLLPQSPIRELDGRIGARLMLQRSTGHGVPDAFLELGAEVTKCRLFEEADERITITGLTAYYSGAFRAEAKQLNGSLIASDSQGALLTATSAIVANPEGWLRDASAEWLAFQDAPLNVVVNIPARSLGSLPGMKLEAVTGNVSGQLALYGNLTDPKVSILVNAKDLRTPSIRDDRPIDATLNGQLQLQQEHVELELSATSLGQRLLHGRLQGRVPVLHKAATPAPNWNAELTLQRVPLSLFEPLMSGQVAGEASGTLSLVQSDAPSFAANFDIDRLSSGRSVLGRGKLTAKGEPGRIEAEFSAAEGERSVNVQLEVGAPVADVPLPDEWQTVQVRARTRQLDAGALAPLLGGLAARPGGNLDLSMNWALQRERPANPKQDPTWRGELSGLATLTDGTAYIEGLGLELRNISLMARAEPLGEETRVSINDLRSEARSDKVNFSGSAELLLDGAQINRGAARFELDSVPITLQGLNLGRASGNASLSLARKEGFPQSGAWRGKDYMDVEVRLARWQMKAAPSASRELIELGRSSDIVVLQSTPAEAKRTSDVLPFHFAIDLGEHTMFTLADLEVPLGGAVAVDYTTTAKMKGTLLLSRGGRIPIFGRVFEIVDGKVVLNPKQPSNPTLDLTLAGRGNEGDMVYVHVGGTLKQPVTEPGPAELQALLGGGAASVLGSGVQALGVSQLLGESVELRVSSADEQEDEASYTAAVRLNDDLWFEANYQKAQSNGLQQEDADAVSGSLDYRFQKRWSVRTKVGNTGGSVDLLWQYRY